MRPLRKARRVNSPGWAARAPARRHRRSTSRSAKPPPCVSISTTGSRVKVAGPGMYTASTSSTARPVAGSTTWPRHRRRGDCSGSLAGVAEQRAQHLPRLWSAQSHDADPARTRRSGDGGYRVATQHLGERQRILLGTAAAPRGRPHNACRQSLNMLSLFSNPRRRYGDMPDTQVPDMVVARLPLYLLLLRCLSPPVSR